jgi:MFS family permease
LAPRGRLQSFRGIPRQSQLVLLFLTNVVTAQNQTIHSSLFSLFTDNLGASPSEIGMMVFLSGVVATALMIPAGILAQRYGKKRIIILSIILQAVALFLYTLVQDWHQVIPLNMLFAASFAFFIPARMIFVADHTTPRNRAIVFSIMNIAWSTGSIYGPIVGGVLADAFPGWKVPFYFMGLSLILSLAPASLLREQGSSEMENKNGTNKFGTELPILRCIAPILVFHVLMDIGVAAVDPLVPLYLETRFRVTNTQVGIFYSLGFGLATQLFQVPTGYLADKKGKKKILIFSSATIPVLYLLCTMAGDYLTLMVIYLFINALWSMTWPTSMAILLDAVPTQARQLAVSVRQTSIRLGSTIGPLLGGFAWDLGGGIGSFFVAAFFAATSVPAVLLQKEAAKAQT